MNVFICMLPGGHGNRIAFFQQQPLLKNVSLLSIQLRSHLVNVLQPLIGFVRIFRRRLFQLLHMAVARFQILHHGIPMFVQPFVLSTNFQFTAHPLAIDHFLFSYQGRFAISQDFPQAIQLTETKLVLFLKRTTFRAKQLLFFS